MLGELVDDVEPGGGEVVRGGVDAITDGLGAVGVCAEVLQTSEDRGRTSVAIHRFESLTLLHISWGCGAHVRTNFGADCVAVSAATALPQLSGQRTVWTGTRVTPGHIGAVPAGHDSESLTPQGAQAIVALVDWSAVTETADALGRQAQPLAAAGPLPPSLGLFDAVVALTRAGRTEDARHAGFARRAMDRLLEGLVTGARPSTADRPRAGYRLAASARIVSVALELAEADGGLAPSMRRMCAATGMSERRVRDAFVDTKGMPPQTYFQVRSLNLAREQLRARSPKESTVTDIAGSLGIWHLGRFAARYRSLFGETPQQTLMGSR
jgi:AraC family ethanolamine operon transcriptional activator